MAGPSALPAPSPAFHARKDKILSQLAVPDADYADASPKGSVDVGIRPLLEKINASSGFVTTSSCAGRVSVFVEGRKAAATTTQTAAAPAEDGDDGDEMEQIQPSSTQTVAGLGGKGGGGTWLYVSHDPHPKAAEGGVVDWATELGIVGEGDDGLLLDATGGGEEKSSEKRLIHFKFEPMVRCTVHPTANSQAPD